MEKFEEQLTRMTKPQVPNLKHQNMLESAIIHAKDEAVLSWWWESVPLYIIAAFLMKTIFVSHTTLVSDLHNMNASNPYTTLLFFVIVPVVFIIINIFRIRRIHFLSGSPKIIVFLPVVRFNVLIVLASIFILVIYSLQMTIQ